MTPKFIDTHAHLNFRAFENDYSEIIARTLEQSAWMINVGSQIATSKKAISIAREYRQGVYASVGFHPTHALDFEWNKNDLEALLDNQVNNKIVALGETGLDYFRLPKEKEEEHKTMQKQIFSDHIDLAEQYHLPLILHCRDAYADVLEAIRGRSIVGVAHCFIGNMETAKQFIDLGCMISFTGIITFTKDQALLEAVKRLPLEKIMIETDCPYLAPVPMRGKRNEPLFAKHVGEAIAKIKGISAEEVLKKTTYNAIQFFRLAI